MAPDCEIYRNTRVWSRGKKDLKKEKAVKDNKQAMTSCGVLKGRKAET